MSRIGRFVSGMASSYVVLGTTAIYSLAAVPIALHYLGKEQFGLWALMLQIAGYLQLLDIGVSTSLPRLLIEHKDDQQSSRYGSMLLTAWLVLLVPAVILFATGHLLGAPIADLMALPDHLRELFSELFRWQCVLAAIGFGTRIFGALLIAHQRIDVYNYSQLLLFAANFPVLWFGLSWGGGVFSFMWAQWVGTLVSTCAAVFACWSLGLFPKPGLWGSPSLEQSRPMFRYAIDLFFVTLGTQLILASQTVIVARFLTLEASAVWAAGSRAFQLLCQLTWRVSDVCGAAFAEMMVRGEVHSLHSRHKEVTILTASLGCYAAVGLAMCNNQFVALWTGGKITWSPLYDALLGVWLVILGVGHCHNGFVLLTKRIGLMRYIYFVEGALSVVLASFLVPWGGVPAMLLVSIAAMLTLDFAYGVWRVAQYFRLPVSQVAVGWMATTGRFVAVYLPLAISCFLLTVPFSPAVRLAVNITFCLTIGLMLLVRLGLPRALQLEIAIRTPPRLSRAVHYLFAVRYPTQS